MGAVMDAEIIDYKFYTAEHTVGFVLVKDTKTKIYCCYTGQANQSCEFSDIEYIRNFGAPIERKVANVLFGRQIRDYEDII